MSCSPPSASILTRSTLGQASAISSRVYGRDLDGLTAGQIGVVDQGSVLGLGRGHVQKPLPCSCTHCGGHDARTTGMAVQEHGLAQKRHGLWVGFDSDHAPLFAHRISQQERVIAEIRADIDHRHAGLDTAREVLRQPHFPEAVEHEMAGEACDRSFRAGRSSDAPGYARARRRRRGRRSAPVSESQPPASDVTMSPNDEDKGP